MAIEHYVVNYMSALATFLYKNHYYCEIYRMLHAFRGLSKKKAKILSLKILCLQPTVSFLDAPGNFFHPIFDGFFLAAPSAASPPVSSAINSSFDRQY